MLDMRKSLVVIKNQPYHYKKSGLDNVFLHGIIQYKCNHCGEKPGNTEFERLAPADR